MSNQENAYAQIESLIQRFKALTSAARKDMNENATRQGYILPLFRALGWNVDNTNEVSPEEKVSRGWVDFSFRIGGIPRYFLETKKASEDLNQARWVQQAIDYAWTKSVTWALLSDFEGLRVFNAEWKETDPFRAQFLEFDLETYLPDFERLWWFSREETAAGRLEREADKVGKRIKRLPVSQNLFDDLRLWRSELYKSLRQWNPLYSPAQIDEAVLRLLNRLIFIRTAEDREVESLCLMPLLRELEDKRQMDKLSVRLAELFRRFDSTYNSELFAAHFSEELYCDRMPLEALMRGLYEKNFIRYNFNALEADVLGTAYEQYLGHIVTENTEEGGGKPSSQKGRRGASPLPFNVASHVEEKRTKRKSQGIYYTPAFVTKYIVQQTVGHYLDEQGYNPSKPPRILDMACGSGSFLIEAFDALDRFVANMRHQTGTTPTLPPPNPQSKVKLARNSSHADLGEVPRPAGEWAEGIDFRDNLRRLELMQACIFGVDKDKQAVDVARLNLMLRALHGRQKLPLLTNIYNADSLHPETWEQAFPEVMKEGGFDVIIGNPPYVRIQTLNKSEVEFFNKNFKTATGNYDIYVLFVEQALRLLKPGGVMGFILPNKFMQVDYGIGLRKLLSENKYVQKIVDFKESQVFEGATTYTCLLFLIKQENPSYKVLSIDIGEEKPSLEIFNVPEANNPANGFTEKTWSLSTQFTKTIFDKLTNPKTVSLLELPSQISRGSSSGADEIYILGRIDDNHFKVGNGKSIEIEPEIMRIPLYATDFGRYQFRPKSQERIIFPYDVSRTGYSLIAENELKKSYPKAYKYLASQRERLEKRKDYRTWYAFSAPRNLNVHVNAKVVVPLLVDKGQYAKLPEDTSNFCLMASGGFSISFGNVHLSTEYLIGLLNSSLLFWYLHQISNVFRGGWITCTKQYVGQLPIRRINFADPEEKSAHDEIIKLVEQMVDLQKQRQKAEAGKEDMRFALQKRIQELDEEIDGRVYRLYGLSPEEINIVEGKE
jgi:type I restriction-modification system DNA methylase subunit